MSAGSKKLRDLLERGQPFVAADCYSALTARIVEDVGFEAAYLGGRATALMHYAMPDCGILTPTEMIEQAARVREVISVPLIVDADQAGESIADVRRTVRRFEDIGVAAIHIEDEVTPKHSNFAGPLMSIPEMQARISAAVETRRDESFVIIARCDELWTTAAGLPAGGGGSLEEVVRRGRAYEEAGADLFMPILATESNIAEVAKEVNIPLTGFGRLLPGMAFSLFGGWGAFSAGRVHREWAMHLREHGDLPPEVWALPDEARLIDQKGYNDVVAEWCKATSRPTR